MNKIIMQIIWNSQTLFLTGILAIACCCWYKRIIWVREQEPSVYAHLHELLSKDEMTAIGRHTYIFYQSLFKSA